MLRKYAQIASTNSGEAQRNHVNSRFFLRLTMTDPYIDKILSADVYDVAKETPLTEAPSLSERLGCDVFLKREDLNRFSALSVVVRTTRWLRSQLNSAPEVWLLPRGQSCTRCCVGAQKLGVDATIVMPVTTPSIKVDAVRRRVQMLCSRVMLSIKRLNMQMRL